MPSPTPPSEDRPLRLAYLSYRSKPTVGGQGIYTRHLTKALADLGHEVEVLSGQPYPVLDSRVRLTQLPSLDIFNDLYPGRMPAFWELKSLSDLIEVTQYSAGTFSEPDASAPGAVSRRQPASQRCLPWGDAAKSRCPGSRLRLRFPRPAPSGGSSG